MNRLERFEWVLETFAGAKDAARPFDRLVSAKDGHTGTLLVRLREKPDEAGLDGVTIAKIMRATGVNPVWLMFGEGPRIVDVAAGDPELSNFLADLGDRPKLRSAAFAAHATLSEVKTLLQTADREKTEAEWRADIDDQRKFGHLAKAAESLGIDPTVPESPSAAPAVRGKGKPRPPRARS